MRRTSGVRRPKFRSKTRFVPERGLFSPRLCSPPISPARLYSVQIGGHRLEWVVGAEHPLGVATIVGWVDLSREWTQCEVEEEGGITGTGTTHGLTLFYIRKVRASGVVASEPRRSCTFTQLHAHLEICSTIRRTSVAQT